MLLIKVNYDELIFSIGSDYDDSSIGAVGALKD
jgi:hypothetical protein